MENPKITKEEFIEFYANNMGVNIEQLDNFGLTPVRCDCGEAMCKGWQMIHKSLKPYYESAGQ